MGLETLHTLCIFVQTTSQLIQISMLEVQQVQVFFNGECAKFICNF